MISLFDNEEVSTAQPVYKDHIWEKSLCSQVGFIQRVNLSDGLLWFMSLIEGLDVIIANLQKKKYVLDKVTNL